MIQNGFWGKEYPKADYPIRERKKVKVFNIKKFVDEKRKKKMEEMFGPSAGKGPMPSRPMPGGMPSRPMTPPMGPTPPAGDFNVDEIVKRIDAKIAELEEEERREKEEMERKRKREEERRIKEAMDAKRKEKQEQQRAQMESHRPKPPVSEPPRPKEPPRPITDEKKPTPTVMPTPPKVTPVPQHPDVRRDVRPQPNIVPPTPKEKEEAVFSAPIYGDTDFPKPSVPTPERKPAPKPQVESRVITPAVTDDQFFDDFFSDDDDE